MFSFVFYLVLLGCHLIGFAAAGTTKPLSCSEQARHFAEFHDIGFFTAVCLGGCQNSDAAIKGSQIYTDHSSVCKAAIHAGVINDNGGPVKVRRLPGRSSYISTVHNGITSQKSASWTHSYSFEFASTTCVRPLGLRSHNVSNANFRASSSFHSWGQHWHPYYARLDKGSLVNAWRPEIDNTDQWWKIDLGDIYDVRGIVTQGSKRFGNVQFITSFKIQHKLTEDSDWLNVLNAKGMPKIFHGNSDNNGRVTNNFVPSLTARYLCLRPVTWKNHISLRAEIYVCSLSQTQ